MNRDSETATRAEHRLESVLRNTGAPDPRDLHRQHLRELRRADPEGYGDALAYYRGTLLPKVAADGSEPLVEWAAFGRLVAKLIRPGDAVRVAGDGLAEPLALDDDGRPVFSGELILHLPSGKGRALVISEPADPTPAQSATRALLVEGRRELTPTRP